jgi:hypothetical protein
MKTKIGMALYNLTAVESLFRRMHPIMQNPVTLMSAGKGVGQTVEPKFHGIVSQAEDAIQKTHIRVDDRVAIWTTIALAKNPTATDEQAISTTKSIW